MNQFVLFINFYYKRDLCALKNYYKVSKNLNFYLISQIAKTK